MQLGAFLLPVRIVQGVFSIIVLGTLAYTANAWSNFIYLGAAPSEVSFLIFCAVWTWLVLAYLILAPILFPVAAHRFAILAVEAVTMLFWFAGFIALAAILGPGWGYRSGPSKAASAGTAFGAFEWLLFVFTTVVAAMAAFGGRRTKAEASAEPGPAMTAP